MPTIVIIPEYKAALAAAPERGLRLFTVHVRRGAPDVQDPSLNSHSKLNCISACIQARAQPASARPVHLALADAGLLAP